MSPLLNCISKAFDRRMGLRRRMLAHLGLAPTQAEAPEMYDDLRATLLACSGCAHPDICEYWLDKAHDGSPLFCEARLAFARLNAAQKETA